MLSHTSGISKMESCIHVASNSHKNKSIIGPSFIYNAQNWSDHNTKYALANSGSVGNLHTKQTLGLSTEEKRKSVRRNGKIVVTMTKIPLAFNRRDVNIHVL